MAASIESQVAMSAVRFATELVTELRRAPVSELLALASAQISPRVELGAHDARAPRPTAGGASAGMAKLRIERAVDEIVVAHGLTERERFMLVRVAYGALRDELAEAMGIARQTAKMHIRALLRKLDAKALGEVAARILHRAASFE